MIANKLKIGDEIRVIAPSRSLSVVVLVYKCGHEKFNTVKYFYERCVLNGVQKRCPIFGRIQTSDY